MKTQVEQMMAAVEWTETPREPSDVSPPDGIPYATHTGVLRIMDQDLRVARLSDGRAVIVAEDLERFFGMDFGGENK